MAQQLQAMTMEELNASRAAAIAAEAATDRQQRAGTSEEAAMVIELLEQIKVVEREVETEREEIAAEMSSAQSRIGHLEQACHSLQAQDRESRAVAEESAELAMRYRVQVEAADQAKQALIWHMGDLTAELSGELAEDARTDDEFPHNWLELWHALKGMVVELHSAQAVVSAAPTAGRQESTTWSRPGEPVGAPVANVHSPEAFAAAAVAAAAGGYSDVTSQAFSIDPQFSTEKESDFAESSSDFESKVGSVDEEGDQNTMGLVSKNDEFCIENEEFCIQNGEFCRIKTIR